MFRIFFDIIFSMHRKIKAFTLIELLVVIAIVGILAGFIFVSMMGAINSAKDTKIKADMATIEKAVMEYAALNSGTYPTLLSTLVPTYLGVVPTDPSGNAYAYTYTSGTNVFTLTGTLSTGLPWVYDSSTSSWGSGYTYGQYKKVITITNNPSSSAITGAYPIKLTIDTSALIPTKMRSDCNDLRFSDNPVTTNLSYWIESGCNTSATIVWVNLPNGIPASPGIQINMYYGTQTASGVSGDATFSFFDHFDGALDTTNKWTLTTGSFAVASSIASNNSGTTNAEIATKYPNISSGVWAFRSRVSMAQSAAMSAWIGTVYNGLFAMGRLSANNYGYCSYNCSWGGPSRGNFGTGYTGYHIVEGIKKISSYATIVDGTQLVDNAGSVCLSDTSWRFNGGASYGNNAISIDWVVVRPYNAAEPVIGPSNFGTETTGQ